MLARWFQGAAIILVALSLVPSGAHLLELARKIRMAETDYLMVQQLYRGWALFGAVLFAALGATLGSAILARGQPIPFRFACAAFLLMALTLVSFFVWVYPVNQVTDNWTVAPENWRSLRARWEWAHAASAVVTMVALLAAVVSALSWRVDQA